MFGCVVSLDHEFDGTGGGDASAGVSVDVVAGCDPFRHVAGATALAGDSRSLPLPDGGAIWVVDQAVSSDGDIVSPASFTVETGAAADCRSWPSRFEGASFAPSPIAPTGFLVALDLVQGTDAPALYYELFVSDAATPLGLRSVGVALAPRDRTSGRFVPTSDLIWAADRPAYGGSAMRVGGTVYVYGCSSSGFLEANCFVARSNVSALASTAGYTYWTGDHWSTNADDAAPIARGGGVVSVRLDLRAAPAMGPRFVMTYVPPLGSTLVARTAVAPEGPWSSPTTLAACAFDGRGAFCSGGQQHPELVPVPGAPLSLTYDARTFAADAGAVVTAFAPHLVTFALP